MPKSKAKSNMIYMDYASSALPESANPGAIHELGLAEKRKLEEARQIIAGILGAHADEIIFTSGATESNNLAILGTVKQALENYVRVGAPVERVKRRNFPVPAQHIVTTNIEHASVLETCKHLGNVTFVAVEKNGIVDPRKIKKALRPNTILVSVMYANNEIGTIQPIREIAKEIRHYNKKTRPNGHSVGRVIFHTDAVQAVNYLPINVVGLGVDMMSLNAAKIYGPKGVGVLYIKRNTPIRKIMFGGEQERGLRPGTENVAGAQALAKALLQTEKIKIKEIKRLSSLQKYFIKKLPASIILNGDMTNRLPNNINITISNIPSDLLVIELSARGIMASAKSACKAGDGKASHVIQAINPDAKDTDGSLRFSLGRDTTKGDIDYTIKALNDILKKLKKWYN